MMPSTIKYDIISAVADIILHNIRHHHKAKARSVDSKKQPAGKYKLEEATRKQHKAQTRSVVKKECGRHNA